MWWRAIPLGLLFLLPAAPALAGTQVNACGRYSIWVPDSWEVIVTKARMTAESRDNGLYLVVAPIEDKSADLIDVDAADFIDDELENPKITSDRRAKLGGIEARIMEGTGIDNGNVSFRAVALDPSENEGLIEMLIYAPAAEMKNPAIKAMVDRIVATFKPAAAVADMQVNACGKYSLWLPDRWKVTIKNEKLTALSRDNKLHLVVAPLEDKTAELLDDDVGDFIDNALDDMKITSDRREKSAGIEARVMEGTGTNEDDDNEADVVFRAVALLPGDKSGVIEILIYGTAWEMKRPENRAIVDRIMRSFKPN